MSAEWVPLQATQDAELPQLLQQNGLSSDEPVLRNIWMSPHNRGLHQPAARPPYRVRNGETVKVPPPPLPPDAVLSTYTCTGSEGSVDAIVTAIKARHGEGALDQLVVAHDAFTSDYLLGLVHNQGFRIRHTGPSPAAIEAGELLRYPTRARRQRSHDVVPSTGMNTDASATVPTGEGAFEVTVELVEGHEILKFADEATRRWRAQPVRFKITITPRQGDVTPIRVTMRVLKEDGSTYYDQAEAGHTWLRNGEHTWDWDGFTRPPPIADEEDRAELDTEVLRSRLTVLVLVEPPVGLPGRGQLQLDNRAATGPYVDVRVNMAQRQVRGTGWVEFHHVSEDGGLWLTLILALVIAAGALVAIEALVMGFHALAKDAEGSELSDDEMTQYMWAMLGTAALVLALGVIAAGITLAALRLSDEQFAEFTGNLRDGIARYWSRSVTMGGQAFQFVAAGRSHADHEAVTFAVMKPLFDGQRAVNLSMVLPFAPIICPYSADVPWVHYEGAHEFGHSILGAAVDKDYSTRHKGTTGGALDQNPRPVGQGGENLPGTGEVDLMKYYQQGFNAESLTRMVASEQDAVRFIEIAQVEFRAM